jgi:hypothetical protein
VIAAALVAALACPAQPALVQRTSPAVTRTAVVACHRGRRIVLTRARMVWRLSGRPVGRRITGVDSAGRRIVWSEMRRGGGRARGSIVVSRRERGGVRRVHRRLVLRGPGALDVVLSSRGELGWLARDHVLTASPRGPARVVARNSAGRSLGLEDDRTLRWFRDTSETLRVAYADLRPWPGDGCPVRRRFKILAESPEAVVSTASYGTVWDEDVEAVRVCARATGKDPVVLQLDSLFGHPKWVSRAMVAGPWAVLVLSSTGKGANCTAESVAIVNAVDGTHRRTRGGCHGATLEHAPMVVTDTGAPAWILRHPDRSAVVTTRGGVLVELDSAGRDGLSDLTAEGTVVRWLHDGEPRAADLG